VPVVDNQRELVPAPMNLVYESGEYFSLRIGAKLLDENVKPGNQEGIHPFGRFDEMGQEPRGVPVVLVDS
jgi:hypothetical protein